MVSLHALAYRIIMDRRRIVAPSAQSIRIVPATRLAFGTDVRTHVLACAVRTPTAMYSTIILSAHASTATQEILSAVVAQFHRRLHVIE